MRALINRITPCTERRIWFTFGLFKQSLAHRPVIQLDCFLSVHGKKSCESRVQSTVQSSPESRFGFVKALSQWVYVWVGTNSGMDYWNGTLDWTTGMVF